jgi:glycerate kinase
VVLDHGLDAVFAIVPRCMDVSDALVAGAENLTVTSRNVAAVLAMKMSLT